MQKVGFTDKEALVYVTLLELGGAYPSRIAEYSGLKRATTYNVLTVLSVRGLVNEIEKRNKIFYQIDKPHKLTQYSDRRVEIAKEEKEKTEKILPDIEEIFSLMADRPKVLFFEGPDTLVNIYKDVVAEKNYEMVGFTNANKFKDTMTAAQLNDYIKAKERLNILTRGITADTPENRAYSQNVFGSVKNKELWPKIRFASPDKFPYEAEIIVYEKNKVGIVKLGGQNIIGVIIEDKTIHDMMKMIFEFAWNSSWVTD